MLRLPVVPAAVTLPDLVSDERYTAVTGSPATPQSRARVKAATATIRDRCGWHVAPVVEQTFVVAQPRGDSDVWVASGRVVSIESVTVDGVAVPAETFEWSDVGSGRVEVTVTHGYDPPANLVMLVCDVAARLVEVDPGVSQLSIGGRTEVYRDPSLSPAELAVLMPYTLIEFG